MVSPPPGRKYQFMEVNRQRQASGLKDKIPDIQKTLETVRFLKTRKVRNQKIPLCPSQAGPFPRHTPSKEYTNPVNSPHHKELVLNKENYSTHRPAMIPSKQPSS